MLEFVLIVLVVFLGWWWLFLARPNGLPPGPCLTFPLLGHLPLMSMDPRPQFLEWRQRYGDVFSFYLGRRLMVVLSGYQVIREALVKHADVFSVRPSSFVTKLITHRGIVFNSGPTWKQQRKISIEILRSLGMGKRSFADKVHKEVNEFVKVIQSSQGQPVDIFSLVNVSASNNICNVVFGRRFEYDNANFLRYLELIKDNFRNLASTSLLNYLPWLRFLPGDLFHAKKILQNVKEMERCFLRPQIQQHITQETEKGEGEGEEEKKQRNGNKQEDFIRTYLSELRKQRADGNISEGDIDDLLWTVTDLFIAGTETLTNSILWFLLFMLHHPHIQHNCYLKICDVIGPTSQPSVRYRSELPYVEATIMETLRCSDISALSLPHGVSGGDAHFRGYRIPRDAIVIPFLHTALADGSVWKDPNQFRPERFLNASGSLLKMDQFIPFCVGRRACPGEGIARQQLFLYATTLLQRFRFLPETVESPLPSLVGVMDFTNKPRPFRIRALLRDSWK